LKTAGVALALLFSVALWQWEHLRSKVLVSSYSVATLAVGLVGFMQLDVVGMQTRRMVKEMSAPSMATTPSYLDAEQKSNAGAAVPISSSVHSEESQFPMVQSVGPATIHISVDQKPDAPPHASGRVVASDDEPDDGQLRSAASYSEASVPVPVPVSL
jgi:hypothetical protein